MSLNIPKPYPGLVISYSYLWCDEAERGLEEGIKNRPCAIVLSQQVVENREIVTVVAITHTPPADPEVAIEIPLDLKRHLGLDDLPSWIIVDEVNHFVWPGPDLRPIPDKSPSTVSYGVLPPGFFRQVKTRLLSIYEDNRVRQVRRTD